VRDLVLPRPYGQLQLRGTFLPMWGLVLPDLPDDEVRAAGEQIARALGGPGRIEGRWPAGG